VRTKDKENEEVMFPSAVYKVTARRRDQSESVYERNPGYVRNDSELLHTKLVSR
jgi:hypothetical protein